MTAYNLYLFLSIFSTTYLVSHSLDTESIRGGLPAFQPDFRYQAAVVGRRNNSYIDYLICAGAIIGKYHVLSIAQCVVNNTSGNLKEFSFSVIAGRNNLKFLTADSVKIVVKKIYIPYYYGVHTPNDLAILMLKHEFNFINKPISEISIGFGYVNEFPGTGTVAGYACNMVAKYKAIQGDGDFQLKYGVVKILSDENCKHNYPDVLAPMQKCGVMVPIGQEKHHGICPGDIGSPFVMHGQLLAIASQVSPDYDDTTSGALYILIPLYFHSIQLIINGTFDIDPQPCTKILINREHKFANLNLHL